MNFMNYDFLLTACKHHQELAKHVADLHLVDRSSLRSRFQGRSLSPPVGRPDAA